MNIDLIKPYEKNAKIHPKKQIEQVANSIKEFGFNQPIVVDKDNVVIVGHGRLEAAKLLGLKDVPVITANLTDEQAKAYRLADNKLNESEWDMGLVIEELKGLSKEMFDLTSFDQDLLIEPDEKDDEVPEVPEEPQSKLGDLYILGNHRVLCGDSTKIEDVDRLIGMEKNVKLVFTSPPYNMAGDMYVNYEDNYKSDEYVKFNIEVIKNILPYLKGFLFWNISYNKNARFEFIEILYKIIKETGLKFLELIVWNKKHAIPITSKEMMTRQYEDILAVGNEDIINEELELWFCGRNDKRAFFNKKTNKGLTNYWEVQVNKVQLDNHKACYPVALPLKAILIMTEEKDVVMDPFGGSGTNLIACVKSNRISYTLEKDPSYIDVIVQRYVDYTGNNKIIKNGKEIIWQKTEK